MPSRQESPQPLLSKTSSNTAAGSSFFGNRARRVHQALLPHCQALLGSGRPSRLSEHHSADIGFLPFRVVTPPEVLKPRRRQLGIAHRVLDVAPSDIGLQRSRVMASVRERKVPAASLSAIISGSCRILDTSDAGGPGHMTLWRKNSEREFYRQAGVTNSRHKTSRPRSVVLPNRHDDRHLQS
jgi:hypothetical protein